MEIIVAKTAGFCFGVKRAVNLAFEADHKEPTYTLGPIIHNDTVIEALKEKGISSVKEIKETPMKRLIIRAHGVGPGVYKEAKEKDIQLIDATCPYVKKIHKLVKKYYEEGFGIIVIGDAKHPEIIGINGWSDYQSVIIKDAEDLDHVKLDANKAYLVVSQTTYKKRVVDEVLERLKSMGVQTTFMNTICSATDERQTEVKQLASIVDGMIVIGSSYSSNTQKLFEIAKGECNHSVCIATADELDTSLFENCKKVGITAGASTPDEVIEAVVKKLELS